MLIKILTLITKVPILEVNTKKILKLIIRTNKIKHFNSQYY